MLEIPDLHDGFLDGIWVSDSKHVHLFVRTLKSERSTIILRSVEALNLMNFMAGNIIFDLVLVHDEDLTIENIKNAYSVPAEETGRAEALLERAKQRHLSALEITASYGAECTVLFGSAEIVPNHVLRESCDGSKGAVGYTG